MTGFMSWWDGVELWLTGLSFVEQVGVVMPVALVLSFGVALIMDRVFGRGVRLLRRVRGADDVDVR